MEQPGPCSSRPDAIPALQLRAGHGVAESPDRFARAQITDQGLEARRRRTNMMTATDGDTRNAETHKRRNTETRKHRMTDFAAIMGLTVLLSGPSAFGLVNRRDASLPAAA